MPESLDPIFVEYATDRVLVDMDALTDWICGECAEQTAVSSDYEFRTPARMAEANTCVLLHGAVTAALESNVMLAGEALKLIAERYLAHSSDRIISLASAAAAGENS